MSTSVRFDVERPATYEPGQIMVRLGLMVVLAVIGAPLGWVFGALFVFLPVVAAVVIASSGAGYYLTQVAPVLSRGFSWLLELYAFLGLLTDRAPIGQPRRVRFEVAPAGNPTVGSALGRLVTSIPAMILLWVLGTVSAVLWVFAAASVVVGGTYPASVFDFQRGILRMFATFIAHHASLVEGAAPLRFETGPDAAADGGSPMPPSVSL
jgi:hypothetical protein